MSTVELQEGEELRTATGTARVTTLTSLPGTDRVYNFTVEQDHVYYVGDLTTLTHNNRCTHHDAGGPVDADTALEAAEKHLGPGYRELPPGSGRYVSADGKRQVRLGDHEVRDPNNTHIHYEGYGPNGKLDESTFTPIR